MASVQYKISLSTFPLNIEHLMTPSRTSAPIDEDVQDDGEDPEVQRLLPVRRKQRRKYGLHDETAAPPLPSVEESTALFPDDELLWAPQDKNLRKSVVVFASPKTADHHDDDDSDNSVVEHHVPPITGGGVENKISEGATPYASFRYKPSQLNSAKRVRKYSVRKARQLRASVVTFVDEHHGWRRFLGILFIIATDAVVTIEHVASKFLVADFDAQRVALMRFAFVPLVLLPFILRKRINPFKLDVLRDNGLLLIMRGVLGSSIYMLRIYAFAKIPLGDATTIMSTAQIFIGLLARVLAGEQCEVINFTTAFFSLAGCVLISRPEFLFASILHYQPETTVVSNTDRLYGSVAAFMSSLLHVMVCRVLARLHKVDPKVVIFHFGIIGWLTSLVAVLTLSTTPLTAAALLPNSLLHCAFLGIMVVANNCSLMLFALALRCESPSVVALLVGPDVVFAFIAQFVFFGVVPHILSIIGALLIVSSIFFIALRKYIRSMQPSGNRLVGVLQVMCGNRLRQHNKLSVTCSN